MVAMRQIITRWTTPAGGAGRTIMYFSNSPNLATQRDQLNLLWLGCAPWMSNKVSWTVETSGDILESTDGQILGTWSNTASYTGTGALVAEPVADATQVLIRWNTDQIVGRRRLRGRTFLPGLASTQVTNGNLGGGAGTGIANSAENFCTFSNLGFGVWSRPIMTGEVFNDRPGAFHPALSSAVWGELARQRRRRR